MVPEPDHDEVLLEAIASLCVPLLRELDAFESLLRRLHPPAIEGLRDGLRPHYAALAEARGAFRELETQAFEAGLSKLWSELSQAAEAACRAAELFCDATPGPGAMALVLQSMQAHAQAQEGLFATRRALPPIDRFFLEPGCRDRAGSFDRPPDDGAHRGGLHHARNDRDARGGFSLWVPEAPPEEPFPLLVVLHGGSGHGADFLFTWLREGRSRRCVILSPTAQGGTWSFQGPDVDALALRQMVDFVAERWPIDAEKILLTGLSDGATYSLYAGAQAEMPFTALAPVSGVLHPAVLGQAGRERLGGLPVYLVHGALDWMFPVELARAAAEQLRAAGCALVYREIEDLSHTYPREENARILDWFAGL